MIIVFLAQQLSNIPIEMSWLTHQTKIPKTWVQILPRAYDILSFFFLLFFLSIITHRMHHNLLMLLLLNVFCLFLGFLAGRY